MSYSSVTVAGMRDLVTSMTNACDQLSATIEPLRAGMSSAGVPTERTRDVDEIADWIESRLPELQRRHSLAVGLSADSPDHLPTRIAEKRVRHNPRTAADHGRSLARILEDGTPTPDTMTTLRSKLAPHIDDPDVMAGFFSELGPGMVELLPRAIVTSEVDDGRGYLRLFSRSLGTALSAPYHHDDLGPVRQMFTGEPENAAQGWDRLALLQDGRFPSTWLARATRANALDEFAGSAMYRDKQRGAELHLSGSTVALAFTALRRDPSAARQALNEYPNSVDNFVGTIYRLDEQNRSHPDVPAAFGAALRAAAEAGERHGDHSRAAERFTADLVTSSAARDHVPPTLRRSLEEIAASYIHEFVASGFSDGGSEAAGGQPPSTPPHDFPQGTGIDPAFYLMPGVARAFIHGFQRSDADLAGPFTEAMGTQFDALLDGAIVADQADGGSRAPDLMRLFGGLNSLVYLAHRDHAANFDAQQRNARSWVAKVFSGVLSLPPLSGVGHYLWSAVQGMADDAKSDWVDDAGGREHDVMSDHEETETILWYLVAERFVEHGIGADALLDAPEGLLNADGGLRPMGEIFPDAELRRDFYEWVNDTSELNNATDEARDQWKIGAARGAAGAAVTPERP